MVDVLKKLQELSSHKLGEFAGSLIPNSAPMLGVSITNLRKLAKDIAKTNGSEFINNNNFEYYELEQLQGMTIAYLKIDIIAKLPLIAKFIYQIHDWSVCDCFCSSFKLNDLEKKVMWNLLLNYLDSNYEFVKRFVVVMMMSHFLTDEYVDKIIQIVDKMVDDRYYFRMGVAWLIATMMAKYPEKTLDYLKYSKLDDWTYNKALQKMVESFRVSAEIKIMLKKMKRKSGGK